MNVGLLDFRFCSYTVNCVAFPPWGGGGGVGSPSTCMLDILLTWTHSLM